MTTNRKDFPSPIWNIIDHNFVTYKLGERYEVINIYLLKANAEAIEDIAKK
jgi:hypothetical protein